jgi:hypothetical protein
LKHAVHVVTAEALKGQITVEYYNIMCKHHSNYFKLAGYYETSDIAYATDVSGMKLFVLFAVQVANCVRDVKYEPLHIQMHTHIYSLVA